MAEKLKLSLSAYKSHLSRARNRLSEMTSKPHVEITVLESSLEYLKRRWEPYEQAYMKYEEYLIENCEKEEIECSQKEFDKVCDEYTESLSICTNLLSTLKVGSSKQKVSSETQSSTVRPKLPSIQIPYFSGDYTEFESFFDQFQAQIGSRPDIEPVTKLQYLKGHLKGNALDLIREFSTVANTEL